MRGSRKFLHMAALSLHPDMIFAGDLHEVKEHVGWLLIFSQFFLQKKTYTILETGRNKSIGIDHRKPNR